MSAQPLTGFTLLLLLQLAGEALVRLTGLPLPGPVAGFVLALLALLAWPTVRPPMRAAADAILPHLSLQFIPAGVGVIMYLGSLGQDAWAIGLSLLVSTLAGLAVTAWVAERCGGASDATPVSKSNDDSPR